MENATQPDKYEYLENILLKGALKGGRWRKLIFSKKSKISKNRNKTKKK